MYLFIISSVFGSPISNEFMLDAAIYPKHAWVLLRKILEWKAPITI